MAVAAVCLSLAACTDATDPGHGVSADEAAAQVVTSLGAVPIPTAEADAPTPTASPGAPQVLAIGAPVAVALPDGTRGVVTALGPQELDAQTAASTPGSSTRGVIDLRLDVTAGRLGVAASDLTSRDETGADVPLASRGPVSASAAPTEPATLQVVGSYHSGSAQVTWRHDGHVLAVWVFTIELD